MRSKLFIPIILLHSLFFISCTTGSNPEQEKAAVEHIVQEFYRSFEEEDMDLMADLMAHDESMLSFGTGLEEHHNGWKEWKSAHLAQFEAFDDIELQSKSLQVYMGQSGQAAWFADVSDWSLKVGGEDVGIDNVRITGVLEQRDGKWKIVQIHASVPQE